MSDLREALTKAYDEASKKEAPDEAHELELSENPVEENEAEVDEKEVDTPTQEQKQDEKSARDDLGRFKAKKEKDATEKAGDTVKIDAPKSWSEPMRAKFATLPIEVQQEIARREEEVHKGFTKHDEERNFGRSLREVIAPYMPIIQAEGGDAPSAVRDLLNTAYILRTADPVRKAQAVQQIIDQFKVDLGLIKKNEYQDPVVSELQKELSNLKNTLAQKDNLQLQAEQSKLMNEIQAFASDPANAYFEQVKPEMAALLGNGRAKNLKEAYDMAIWAREDIRAALLSRQRQEEEAKRRSELEAKKKAAVSVTGSPGPTMPNTGAPKRTLREELEANFKAAIS